MLKLTTAAGTLDVAAYLMPGHADNAITLALGYGRTSAGHVAGLDDDEVNSVGFDSYKLRGSNFAWLRQRLWSSRSAVES